MITPNELEVGQRTAVKARRKATAEDFARADALCLAVMALRPDLPPASLDEWIYEHYAVLTESERNVATAALHHHPDYNPELFS